MCSLRFVVVTRVPGVWLLKSRASVLVPLIMLSDMCVCSSSGVVAGVKQERTGV